MRPKQIEPRVLFMRPTGGLTAVRHPRLFCKVNCCEQVARVGVALWWSNYPDVNRRGISRRRGGSALARKHERVFVSRQDLAGESCRIRTHGDDTGQADTKPAKATIQQGSTVDVPTHVPTAQWVSTSCSGRLVGR